MHQLSKDATSTVPPIDAFMAYLLCQQPTHRFRLGLLPTPLHRWHVPGVPAGVELWIKRDDLTGMQLSGNKVWTMHSSFMVASPFYMALLVVVNVLRM